MRKRDWLLTLVCVAILAALIYYARPVRGGEPLHPRAAAALAATFRPADPFAKGNAVPPPCGCKDCPGAGTFTCEGGCTEATCSARQSNAKGGCSCTPECYCMGPSKLGQGCGCLDSWPYAAARRAPRVGDTCVTDDPSRPWAYGYGREYGWNELGWYRPSLRQAAPGATIYYQPAPAYAYPAQGRYVGACRGGG